MTIFDIFIVIAIAILFVMLLVRNASSSVLSDHIHNVEQRIETIEETLRQIKTLIDELPIPPEIEERRLFERAARITLKDIRSWAHGQKTHLISKSYYYPHAEAIFHEYDYRHDYVDEATPSKFGYEVHGFSRDELSNEWSPFKFLAKDDGCTTSSCSGDIRCVSLL